MKRYAAHLDSWLAGTAVALFYLCVHSYFYNFDGVACAIAVDLDDLSHLVHGNHLAYGILGWGFCRLWRMSGYAGPGLFPLQALSSLLGGAAVGAFHRLCRDQKLSRSVSLAAAAGLAFSYAFWFWSLEAQVYMLGALFLVLAAAQALAPQPRPARLGVFLGLAMLGHVEHVMFAPAALLLLKRGRGRFLAACAAVVLSAYAAAALFIIRPHSSAQWRLWLLGSAALTPDRSFHWHGAYSWTSLAAWAQTTVRIFTGLAPGAAASALALAALGAAAWGARAMGARSKALGVWLIAYAALIVSWEPSTIVYRITDLIALWLLIAYAAQDQDRRGGAFILAAGVAVLAAFNWSRSIEPLADPRNNAAYQEALWIGEATPADSWVAVSSVDHVYVPYFAGRKPLQALDFDLVRRRLAGPEPVFITSESLAAPDWAVLLKGHRLEESSRRGGTILYRIAAGDGTD